MQVGVLVPIKDFGQAKARLATALSPEQRRGLAIAMATRVLAAAGTFPTYVVCDDDDVEAFAVVHGATPLLRPGFGLNGAVTSAVAELGQLGFDRVAVVHSDVPLLTPEALRELVASPGVTLVPDRRDDGTNVAVVPSAIGFEFRYGAGSFRHHAAHATSLRVRLRVVRSPALGLDVDLPDDLAHPLIDGLALLDDLTEGCPPSLPTSPANHR